MRYFLGNQKEYKCKVFNLGMKKKFDFVKLRSAPSHFVFSNFSISLQCFKLYLQKKNYERNRKIIRR